MTRRRSISAPAPTPSTTPSGNRRYLPSLLLIAFALCWGLLAISPTYRQDWALENLAAGVALLWIVRHQLRRPLSNSACLLLFVFGLFHLLGAHYTYAEVPYDTWAKAVFGHSISAVTGWQRNHFDRLVHFLSGALLLPVGVELIQQRLPLPRRAAIFFSLLMICTSAMLYELLEWGAATLFGGDLGQAYLGTQGDVWDAQQDMLMALIGALTTVAVLGAKDKLSQTARVSGSAPRPARGKQE